jgi:DNA helicase-2/ATP-dependent DNA helicase PcrA
VDIFADLNPEQARAVKQLDGPVLILAGAGSGKTKTLTHRLAYALIEKRLRPEQILAVTFTNKAANEMRLRAAKLLGQVERRGWLPYVGTFHGICARILRTDGPHIGIPADFIIFDQADSTAAVNQAARQHHVDTKRFSPRTIQGVISAHKNELITPEIFAETAATPLMKTAAAIWPTYQRLLKDAKALDFDDLLTETVRLLATQKTVRAKWQAQFKLVMIDEYQDTNTAQYKFIRLITGKHNNLCVVGDDWQSIYSWRGADYRNILNFERDFPGAAVIKLEQNYRSTNPILAAANQVIRHNTRRSDKKLWTAKDGGSPVQIVPVSDEVGEAEAVIRLVRANLNGGRTHRDHAVLYRTNAQSRALEEQFIRYGLPYRVVGGVRFYDRKEIKDILAYLRLAYQPDDYASFERIVNVPSRGLGDTSLGRFNAWRAAQDLSLSSALARAGEAGLTPRAVNAFGELKRQLDIFAAMVTELTVAELIEAVIKRTAYEDWLNDGGIQGESRLENVRELISVAREFDAADLAQFLEEVALISDVDAYDQTADAVTLMTLHAAKGLEFPVVFMVGLEEGVFPHSRALFDQDQMEEERRLCYVGMTRAMEELYLLYASRRLLYGSVQHNPPSRFLADSEGQTATNPAGFGTGGWDEPVLVPEAAIDLSPGDQVRHPVFGAGEVTEIDGDMATIRFKKGAKTLNLAFAPLEKV